MTDAPTHRSSAGEQRSFAETAFEMAGKSADEARRVGAVDRADDEVEEMFAERFRTAHSPLHRAVWDDAVPIDLFTAGEARVADDVAAAMDQSLKVAASRLEAGTFYDELGKIGEATLAELGTAGYWGLLVDRAYGGSGASFTAFARFLTRMALLEPTLAGLASVHQCIGAVDPLSAFGSEEQKQRLLPSLATGERLSAFALTEPGAGSDLTALRTTARRDGDHFVVDGEKLFITNALPGRTIALVVKIDDRPAVLIAELPDAEGDGFQLRRYRLHALRNAHNNGLVFDGFRIPADNLLEPAQGDGLTIAYHGLNKGRVALCANAAGTMRMMAASLIPWVHKRVTYGEAIAQRELVRRRLGRLGGHIVACDALAGWTARLLDEGYRGEMECIVAKVFASEAQKDAAIEILMKTHGGRSFLEGHFFGDYVHDFLAPCIYEGEGEMLGMALFKSLVKDHGRRYFEPMGVAAQEAGIAKLDPRNPRVAWAVRKPAFEYGKWMARRRLRRTPRPELPPMPKELTGYAQFAAAELQGASLAISGAMRRYQLKLADRQARIAGLSQRVIDATTILATCLHAARTDDELVRAAAAVVSDELERKLTGRRMSDRAVRRASELGTAVADRRFPGVADSAEHAISMDY